MKNEFSQEPEPQKSFRKPITRRRGRPAKTYFSLQDTMEYISTEKFVNLTQYRNWVIEQNLTHLFPLAPNTYYKGYPGVDAFLGNPPGTAMKSVVAILTTPENRAKSLKVRRENRIKRYEEMKAKATLKVSDEKPVKQVKEQPTSTKPSLSVCFEVLLEHNVTFSTLNKVNKEMANITPKEARDITNELLEFLTKQDTVKA